MSIRYTTCPRCGGAVAGTRKVGLGKALENHLATCPSPTTIKKEKK
jgi:hypothetical protein